MNCVNMEFNAMYPDYHLPTVSDHSIILAHFDAHRDTLATNQEPLRTPEGAKTFSNVYGQAKPVKYKVNGVKVDFMASEEHRQQLATHIDQLLLLKKCQLEMDKWYEAFVSIYHSEMEIFYKKTDITPKSAKNFHIMKKEWWNDDLTTLAKDTHKAEKNLCHTD